jgi:hypothetical protein
LTDVCLLCVVRLRLREGPIRLPEEFYPVYIYIYIYICVCVCVCVCVTDCVITLQWIGRKCQKKKERSTDLLLNVNFDGGELLSL